MSTPRARSDVRTPADEAKPATGSAAVAGAGGVRRLAHWLDAAVRIPGTRIRVGLDALLGLIPGGGDVAGAALSAWIVLTAARRGAPAAVLARMTWNLALDAVLGAVPLVGDLVDVGWKANLRNVDLLERHLESPERTRRRSTSALAGVAAGLIIVLGILGWAAWLAVRGLVGLVP